MTGPIVRAVAQHVAELLGGLHSAGVVAGGGSFPVILICFTQSKEVDRSYREWLWRGMEDPPVSNNDVAAYGKPVDGAYQCSLFC